MKKIIFLIVMIIISGCAEDCSKEGSCEGLGYSHEPQINCDYEEFKSKMYNLTEYGVYRICGCLVTYSSEAYYTTCP